MQGRDAATTWICSPHGSVVVQDQEPTGDCPEADRAFCVWEKATPEYVSATFAKLVEREVAARLQERADEVRDGNSDRVHRTIHATGGGWVEIQAEYLGHLIDRIEYESGAGGGG